MAVCSYFRASVLRARSERSELALAIERATKKTIPHEFTNNSLHKGAMIVLNIVPPSALHWEVDTHSATHITFENNKENKTLDLKCQPSLIIHVCSHGVLTRTHWFNVQSRYIVVMIKGLWPYTWLMCPSELTPVPHIVVVATEMNICEDDVLDGERVFMPARRDFCRQQAAKTIILPSILGCRRHDIWTYHGVRE